MIRLIHSFLASIVILCLCLPSAAAIVIDGTANAAEWADAELIQLVKSNETIADEVEFVTVSHFTERTVLYFKIDVLFSSLEQDNTTAGVIIRIGEDVFKADLSGTEYEYNTDVYGFDCVTGYRYSNGLSCELGIDFKLGLPESVEVAFRFIDASGVPSEEYTVDLTPVPYINYVKPEPPTVQEPTEPVTEKQTTERTTKATTTKPTTTTTEKTTRAATTKQTTKPKTTTTTAKKKTTVTESKATTAAASASTTRKSVETTTRKARTTIASSTRTSTAPPPSDAEGQGTPAFSAAAQTSVVFVTEAASEAPVKKSNAARNKTIVTVGAFVIVFGAAFAGTLTFKKRR